MMKRQKAAPKAKPAAKLPKYFVGRAAVFLCGVGLSQAGFCALYCKFAHKKGFV